MALFRRRPSGLRPSSSGTPLVDDSLPDAQWLAASEQVYKETIESHYGSPESMAAGGQQRESHGDVGAAMYFYVKSIDMLHTAYGFNQMQSRQPSRADALIVDGFCGVLEATLSRHPGSPVAEPVREVTHRLRSISTSCKAVGVDPAIYLRALERIARATPDVRIDDVLWT